MMISSRIADKGVADINRNQLVVKGSQVEYQHIGKTTIQTKLM